MVLSILLFLLSGSCQETILYKQNEDFEVTVDFFFKQRVGYNDSNLRINFETSSLEKKDLSGTGPLPYLIVYFKMIKLADNEVKVRVINNNGKLIYAGKAVEGEKFKIDMGFTDDMKDRVGAFGYDINFINKDKDIVSRATLLVLEDGTFLVNAEKRGKF
ncbi:hypothetical protein BH10BAC4_BH10BAC4_24340 [soil metagenome]